MEPTRELLGRIQRVRGRWKRFVWFKGIAWFLGVGIGALVLGLALAESNSVPAGALVPLRLTLLGLVIATAVRMLILPLLRVPDNAQIARFVEERHPGLEDRLVSAIDVIEKPSERGPFGFLLVRDALDRIRPVRLEDLVNRKKFNVFAGLSAVFAVLLAIALFYSSILFP